MKKVIIIGAGPAGLTAGYELVKDGNEDYEVVILEESQDIGGISKTVKYAIASFIPMVGGVLAESAESVLLSMSLIRNSVGITGIIALL